MSCEFPPGERWRDVAARVVNLSADDTSPAIGTHVDGWGRDDVFARRIGSLSHLRWDITVGGVEHLPARTGALIVINTRRFSLAPVYTALALGDETDRPVRFVGRPDTAPVGAFLRRLGGLIEHPDEVRTALRHRELVVIGAAPTLHPRRAGRIDHRLIGAAVQEKARVYPGATASSPFSRAARVELGREVTSSRRRRGPLAELELADQVRFRIQALLDELGGFKSGTALDWLPLSGMGGQ
jgi:hypothetical protein